MTVTNCKMTNAHTAIKSEFPVVVEDNVITDSARDAVSVPPGSTISRNTIQRSGRDGVHVEPTTAPTLKERWYQWWWVKWVLGVLGALAAIYAAYRLGWH